MKELPDEKTLIEMLEHFKLAEQAAREMCELSTAIALKYQKRMREIREARKKWSVMTDIRELKELINSRFEQLDKKIEVGFAEVKGEIKRLDERINGVETRLDSVDKRLDSVDKRLRRTKFGRWLEF